MRGKPINNEAEPARLRDGGHLHFVIFYGSGEGTALRESKYRLPLISHCRTFPTGAKTLQPENESESACKYGDLFILISVYLNFVFRSRTFFYFVFSIRTPFCCLWPSDIFSCWNAETPHTPASIIIVPTAWYHKKDSFRKMIPARMETTVHTPA